MYRYLYLILSFVFFSLSLQAQNDCEYQLILNDAGGDGWQGARIFFIIESDSTEFMLTGATDTFAIALVEGDSISIRYNRGDNNTDNNIQLVDSDGQVLLNDTNPLQGVRFDDFASCPICPSIDLGAIMNVDSFDTSVVIDWEASDSLGLYQIEYAPCGFLGNPDSVLMAETSLSGVTLTGLTQNTCYDYQIYLICLGGDTSIVSGVQQINTIFTRDVGVSGVFAPEFGQKCDFLEEDTLFLILKNFGAAPQTLIPFDFTLTLNLQEIGGNVEMPVDGLFTGVIAKDSCMAFPFEELINVSEPGEYTINVRTALEGDGDASNDEFSVTFIHTFLLPFFEGFADNTLPDRWSSDEVDIFSMFNGTEVVSSDLDALNSRFELVTARYGRIAENDSLSFRYVFASIDPTIPPADLSVGDELLVEVSRDCGESYELLQVIDMNVVNPNLGQTFTEVNLSLENYISELVNFRFTALRGGTSFRMVLDDINVYECVENSITVNNLINNESGSAAQDGSIVVSPTGGIEPYTFAWSTNEMSSGISSGISDLLPGEYSVTVTDAFNCSVVSFFNVGTVSTSELSDLLNLNLYPNPAREILTLDLALEKPQDLDLNIYNAIGQRVWADQLPVNTQHNMPISVANFSPGIYFMQISSEQGQVTKRFVVEK